jgi:DNA-binding response OmpR family regulator
LMLPEIDGVAVCRALRTATDTPIMMLTASPAEEARLRGLETGADDFVTKPFSPHELVACVAALLRRSRPSSGIVQAGNVEIDLGLRQVRQNGEPVAVTATEFRLLEVLASSPGRAFTRSEIAERAFGNDYEGLERTIDVHIMNLRRKLHPRRIGRGLLIATVFGTGYRLEGTRGD